MVVELRPLGRVLFSLGSWVSLDACRAMVPMHAGVRHVTASFEDINMKGSRSPPDQPPAVSIEKQICDWADENGQITNRAKSSVPCVSRSTVADSY